MAALEYIDKLHTYKVVDFIDHWIDKLYAMFHDFTQSPCVCILCTSPPGTQSEKELHSIYKNKLHISESSLQESPQNCIYKN